MPTTLLHLDSSILGDNSVSRTLSKAVVERLRRETPDLVVTYRDLAASPLPHLSGADLAGASADVLDEFLAADVVVIGVALYNFTISSQLKAWIDRVLIAGKTFRYTETGPVGLAGGKRVVLAIARGGRYGPGTPAQALEHAETYLRSALGFIGIAAPEVILAEGLALGADERQAAIRSALDAVETLKVA